MAGDDVCTKSPNYRTSRPIKQSFWLCGPELFDRLVCGYPLYAQSKLANLLFTRELNKQFEANEAYALATSAHPGWTVTGLQRGLMHGISRIIGQSPPMGALPTLRAATDSSVHPNDYYGPDGFMEMRGHPKKVDTSAAAKDDDLADRLWQVSEEMTAVHYDWNGKGQNAN